VQVAEQPLIDHGLDQHELGAEANFEADHRPDTRLADGVADLLRVFPVERDRFLDDQVLAGTRGRDRLRRMQRVRGADVDDVDVGVGEHRVVVGVRAQRHAVLRFERRGVVLSTRTDGRDARARDVLERLDVRARHPPEPDDANPQDLASADYGGQRAETAAVLDSV
jgi:hypothetical protein